MAVMAVMPVMVPPVMAMMHDSMYVMHNAMHSKVSNRCVINSYRRWNRCDHNRRAIHARMMHMVMHPVMFVIVAHWNRWTVLRASEETRNEQSQHSQDGHRDDQVMTATTHLDTPILSMKKPALPR